MNTSTPRRLRLIARRAPAVATSALMLTACQFGGLNSIDMPGTKGHGQGSFTITVELPDVATLPQNSPVLVDDVTVGSVSGMRPVQRADGTFYAALAVSLQRGVDLPANAVATVGQTSLLGSRHLALSAPTREAPTGSLANGSVVTVDRGSRSPSTEEVLSSLGVVVNNGNLGALQDITDELYSAVAGRSGQFAAFLPRLAELTASVRNQTADVIAAGESLDRFAGQLARGNDKLARALDSLPAALKVLNANGRNLVDAFAALRQFASIASRILAQTKDDFAADLKDAYAIVKPLTDHADELIEALPILVTYPLPQTGIKQAVRGDFLNVFITLDLTLRRFGENLFTTSPLDPNMKHLSEVVNPPDFLTGSMANLSGQAADPFKIPPRPTSASGGG
ncbi:MAG: MCE family protein [Actinomycetota bacterium]